MKGVVIVIVKIFRILFIVNIPRRTFLLELFRIIYRVTNFKNLI